LEKAEIANDIKEIKQEARSLGYEMREVNQLLRERRLTDEQRQEHEALMQIYRAEIGMLNGTPLGDAARRRLARKKPSETHVEDERQEELPEVPELVKPPAPPTAEQIDAAKVAGSQAAADGKSVLDNPFGIEQDILRASWEEGWCAQTGSDGMDIPDAWKRQKKKEDA
jgi:hypothetical protein